MPGWWGWPALITRAAMGHDQVRIAGNGPSPSSPGSRRLIRSPCRQALGAEQCPDNERAQRGASISTVPPLCGSTSSTHTTPAQHVSALKTIQCCWCHVLPEHLPWTQKAIQQSLSLCSWQIRRRRASYLLSQPHKSLEPC